MVGDVIWLASYLRYCKREKKKKMLDVTSPYAESKMIHDHFASYIGGGNIQQFFVILHKYCKQGM